MALPSLCRRAEASARAPSSQPRTADGSAGKTARTLAAALAFATALAAMAWPASGQTATASAQTATASAQTVTASAQTVTVFAAASLRGPLDEAVAAWREAQVATGPTSETASRDNAGRDVASGHPPGAGTASGAQTRLVYAGSSALARQIAAGAPADIFVSANAEWMDVLAEAGRLAPGSRARLVGNRLALVGAAGTPALGEVTGEAVRSAIGGARLAMALVEAVPAGIYGRAALTSLGVWDELRGQVVQADDVRGALALVARGEVAYGIVYATDAALFDEVETVGLFPTKSHPRIVYPIALIGEPSATARSLLAFLLSDAAADIFATYGFTSP